MLSYAGDGNNDVKYCTTHLYPWDSLPSCFTTLHDWRTGLSGALHVHICLFIRLHHILIYSKFDLNRFLVPFAYGFALLAVHLNVECMRVPLHPPNKNLLRVSATNAATPKIS